MKKKEVLAWTLENKKLDVEIKREELAAAKARTKAISHDIEADARARRYRDEFETVSSLHRHQEGFIKSLKEQMNTLIDSELRLSQQVMNLKVRNEQILNSPAVRFVASVRNFFGKSN